jgi:hypothetical protein
MNFSFTNLSDFVTHNGNYPVCSSDVGEAEKCFIEVFRNSPLKIFLVFISFILTIINILLPYGIIWYERFGTDNKRTLMNKLVKTPVFLIQSIIIIWTVAVIEVRFSDPFSIFPIFW